MSQLPETADKALFLFDTHAELARAKLPESRGSGESLQIAFDVKRRLAAIAAGELVIEPPLEQDQLNELTNITEHLLAID